MSAATADSPENPTPAAVQPSEPATANAEVKTDSVTYILPVFPGQAEVTPQPFALQNCALWHFILDCEPGALQVLVDRYLNQPGASKFAHHVARNQVALVFVAVEKVVSGSDGEHPLSWGTESSVAFLIPIVRVDNDAQPKQVEEYYFAPYFFVDNPFSMVYGREIYGLLREFGRIGLPTVDQWSGRDATAFQLTLDAVTIDRFGPASRMETARLLTVSYQSAQGADQPQKGADVVNLIDWLHAAADEFLAALGNGATLARSSSTDRENRVIPLISLKQIYEASLGDLACYQRLVKIPLQLQPMQSDPAKPMPLDALPGECDIILDSTDMHPIARDLGLPGKRSGVWGARTVCAGKLPEGAVIGPKSDPVGTNPPLYVHRWTASNSPRLAPALTSLDQAACLVSPQPFSIRGYQLYLFLLKGTKEALVGLCNCLLNQPTGEQLIYKPVSGFVLLAFTQVDAISSSQGVYGEMGYAPERSASFLIPVTRHKPRDPSFPPDPPTFFVPFAFVDNPFSVIYGREIYGFPKHLAWIDVPSSPRGASVFSVETNTAVPLDGNTAKTRVRLLKVEREAVSAGAQRAAPLWRGALTDVRWWIGSRNSEEACDPTDIDLAATLVRDLLSTRTVRLVFLKQYYEIDNGTRACYQALVQADIEIGKIDPVSTMPLPGRYKVTVRSSATDPIAQRLGFECSEDPEHVGELHSLRAGTIRCDATLQGGKVVWPIAR